MEGLATAEKKPHVICVPVPGQSHILAMLKLAQLLHYKGLQVTFVNTDYTHKQLLKSGGVHSLQQLDDFRFESFPDGIPRTSEDDEGRGLHAHYVGTTFLSPFIDLVSKLPTPPTCIISDGFMSVFTIDAAKKLGIPIMLYWSFAACGFMGIYHFQSLIDKGLAPIKVFTIEAAKELGIPIMLYWTLSACGFMGIYQVQSLIEKGLTPLKDESCLTNGYLETIIDWIPGMEGIRLKDMNSIIRTTDPNDKLLSFCIRTIKKSHDVIHNIFHTFDSLEISIVNALSSMFPQVYMVGPLQLHLDQIPENEKQTKMSNFSGYSLWKEESECLQWLESKEPNSVIYVNYGSFTVMSLQDLIEFGWGLANSNHYFLWIIRSDLVVGETAALPPEFEEYIEKKGFIASWCSQEKVLNHPSVGGFLTHCGWGSTIESLSAGVPMICWPYLWDQVTNCRYICKEWEVGLEMGNEVKREEVSKLVQELMGEGGNKMRNKAIEWQEKARTATRPNGSSSVNMNKLIEEIIMLSRN